jgi:ubiquinone/menaquinone biosynthesis C-methylase UbiE
MFDQTEGCHMSTQPDQIRDLQRETWDKFSAGWKKWDDMVTAWLAPVGQEMIRAAALRETANVLDVAAGTGEPGLTAATRVPKGTVTITDLSEGMLEVAREKAARRRITNLATKLCDACALPFADDSFDAVLCRFGFMFFPDIGMAAREFSRVAKPGARVCAAVWNTPDKNSWATTIMGTITKMAALPAPPPGAPGLFRCAPAGFMEDAYQKGGLKDVAVKEVMGEFRFDSAQHYWTFMTEVAAPVVAGLAKVDEATREKIKATVLDLAEKSSSNGKPLFHWSALVIHGSR